jgi:ferredoxin
MVFVADARLFLMPTLTLLQSNLAVRTCFSEIRMSLCRRCGRCVLSCGSRALLRLQGGGGSGEHRSCCGRGLCRADRIMRLQDGMLMGLVPPALHHQEHSAVEDHRLLHTMSHTSTANRVLGLSTSARASTGVLHIRPQRRKQHGC